MKHEIFGWAFDHEPKKLDDLFDCVRDADDEVIYESKQTYEHREEGLNFDKGAAASPHPLGCG